MNFLKINEYCYLLLIFTMTSVSSENIYTSENSEERYPTKDSHRSPRILGLNVGDSRTNFEAGMWILALVGMLAFAGPAILLEPSLGFRRAVKFVMPSRATLNTIIGFYNDITSPELYHDAAERVSNVLHTVLDALENIAEKYEEDESINEI